MRSIASLIERIGARRRVCTAAWSKNRARPRRGNCSRISAYGSRRAHGRHYRFCRTVGASRRTADRWTRTWTLASAFGDLRRHLSHRCRHLCSDRDRAFRVSGRHRHCIFGRTGSALSAAPQQEGIRTVSALLSVRDISFSYGSRRVLRSISFEVPPASAVALLGANGAGKTTLLKLCAGLLSPTQGEILLQGKPLNGYKRRDLAKRIALVPQEVKVSFDFHVRQFDEQ